ncbi:hypothetical protein DIE23_25110 [Burkholderia sp. Bp9143]|uniref:hypothetical protein n=1 Tax=Burkholderia sp. Bp9143 TaxID=2184574 RepID=UPI000F5A1127|nr:hypothetical protein [Burkholderia sp. Bp9143]RQR28054.1 hypothetical protein DIE23_25110 [Burkholderia sp. Bp9143]
MNARVADKQTASDLESARAAQKAAEIDHYLARIAHQRERYATAYRRCDDSARREAADGMVAAATMFERDGKTVPSRLKKAAETIKIAVFLLDPKAPA